MSATGTLTISGSVTGLPGGGTKTIAPPKQTMANAQGEVLEIALANGDNAIDIPAGATYCVITPPADNAVALGLGTGGSVHIAPNLPFPLPLRSGDASFILNAASALTSLTEFNFI